MNFDGKEAVCVKVLKITCILFDIIISFLRMHSKEGNKNLNICKYLAAKMFITALVIIAKKEKQ